MDPNTDSRTASFSLKRPHTEPTQSENGGTSVPVTSRKRARRVEDPDIQDGRELVPAEETPDTAAALLDGQEISIKGCAAGQQHDSPMSQSIPSMNWNSGSKAKIRVSLRDPPTGSQAADTQTHPKKDPTSINVPEVQGRLAKHIEKTSSDRPLSPSTTAVNEGRRLYIGNLSYDATEADVRDFFQGYSIEAISIPQNPHTSRSAGYAFVNLAEPVQAARAVEQLSGSSVLSRKVSIEPAHGKEAKGIRGLESPKDSPDSKSTKKRKENLHHDNGAGNVSTSKQNPYVTTVPLDSDKSRGIDVPLAEQPADYVPREDGKINTLASRRSRNSPCFKEDSESDTGDGVVLNLQDESEHESGEIAESDTSRTRSDQRTFDDVAESSSSDYDAEEQSSHLADEDAMLQYASSEVPTGYLSHRYSSSTARTKRVQPQILADLDAREIELQLRYFYVAKALGEVDLDEPVRCLTCAGKGHMAGECNQMNCARCGEQRAHTTRNCPSMPVPLKIKRSQSTICELCQRNGHASDECELFWRTSGRPWDSDLNDRIIRFECYECGKSGHLGNGCPTRRPGKPPGSSSWTYHGHSQATRKSSNGISIKGRAQQKQQPVINDDSDDEVANFHRPKITGPARHGQIHISMGRGQKSTDDRYRSQQPSGSRNNDYRPDYRDRDYDNPRRSGPGNYGVQRRRSASPRAEEYGSGNSKGKEKPARYPPSSVNGDSYVSTNPQPPLPQGPPPFGYENALGPGKDRRAKGGQSYRPVPSSGRQAWMQFRK
ncbi:MAG: hypothetical protein Q9223_004188 [Gallowayella weberi]